MADVAGSSDPPDRGDKKDEPVPGGSKDDDTKRKASSSSDDEEKSEAGRKTMRKKVRNRDRPFLLNYLSGSESDSSLSSSISGTSSYSSLPSPPNRTHREVFGGTSSDENEEVKNLLKRGPPKHKWFMIPEILKRPMGSSNVVPSARNFEQRAHGSLHAVQRLELNRKLKEHTGCVNCIHFNESGSLLASCSDDRTVCLWDWASGRLKSRIKTSHTSNVFQSKFLPLLGHVNIITCGRDGRVKHHELDASGSLRCSHNLGCHKAPAHKLSLVAGSPHCFLSCGEDGDVKMFDIRTQQFVKKARVVESGTPVTLYTIDCHPTNEREFAVAGFSENLRIYDLRKTRIPIWKQAVETLPGQIQQITCAVYNHNGTEIIASCTKNIYLWALNPSKPWQNIEIEHKYVGSRNRSTIKGVNFFGPKSEYIMSGSDCGNIFMWDKETEAIVQFMPGDDGGVVNCLESHPTVPVLATSGLDDDVKIWMPSSELEPDFGALKSTLLKNINDENMFLFPLRLRLNPDMRGGSVSSDGDGFDDNGIRVSCSQS